jgi:UDP-N-acetylglucosamine 2-epimerase (non-hydrolysing)
MIDSLLKHKEKAKKSKILSKLNLNTDNNRKYDRKERKQLDQQFTKIPYAVLTLHRPGNVDHEQSFNKVLRALVEISQRIPIIFPIHPRTRKQIKKYHNDKFFIDIEEEQRQNLRISPPANGIYLIDPLGYLDFLHLMSNAKMVLTDSGGIQEETTVLKIPCITLRNNTERPVTVEEGTNVIVGCNTEKILSESFKIIENRCNSGRTPELWDGKAAKRIIKIIEENYRKRKS